MVAEQQLREKTVTPRTRVTPTPTSNRTVPSLDVPRSRRAVALHKKNRVFVAVLVATFTATILCLYLFAYANVTSEGFNLSRFRALNREANLRRNTLQAEISRLSLPQTVAERAAILQMEPGTPQTLTIVSDKSSPATTPERPIP